MLSMESSQTSLPVLEKLCAGYGKFSDIAKGAGKTVLSMESSEISLQVLDKLYAEYGKL